MAKARKVSASMWPYFKKVCDRDSIEIIEKRLIGDNYYIVVEVSSRRFTEIVVDAKCEKQRVINGSLPVYSLKTIQNPKKLHRLMDMNGTKGFVVLREDQHKYARKYSHT